MVLDLGRDYYKLSGSELDALGQKVRSGDMEQVLRVYEQEMQVSRKLGVADLQSPLKSALMGSLVRTLLIQVQKTKVCHPTISLTTDRSLTIAPLPRPSPPIPTTHIRIRRCRSQFPYPIRCRRIPPQRMEGREKR